MEGIIAGVVMEWVCSASVEPKSARSYVQIMGIYLDFLEDAGLSLDTAGAADFRRFAQAACARYRESMASGVVNTVKRFYKWAAGQGICRDIAGVVEFDDGWVPYSRAPLGAEEAVAVIDSATNARDRAMLSLLLRCDLRPRDVLAATVDGLLLLDGSGEVRLADGSWLPLTRSCASDLRRYVDDEGLEAVSRSRLFTARKKGNAGVSLNPRTLRGIVSGCFARSGTALPAGEYATGSAALQLAIAEHEPLDVVVALCDRSYHYRRRWRSEGR